MRAYQLFQEMPPELATQLFTELREHDRNIYKTSLASLAGQKKLRPVFVQRKPLDQQIAWMHKTLRLKSCDETGEHLFQIWLLSCHPEMLTEFLDATGIEHDGKGAVDNLPKTLDAAKLKTAVDELFEKHPAPIVRIYLHLFQLQRSGGWEELGALIEADDRLSEAGPEAEAKEEA